MRACAMMTLQAVRFVSLYISRFRARGSIMIVLVLGEQGVSTLRPPWALSDHVEVEEKIISGLLGLNSTPRYTLQSQTAHSRWVSVHSAFLLR
jgi:hypothetical protein